MRRKSDRVGVRSCRQDELLRTKQNIVLAQGVRLYRKIPPGNV
jgi:hypothetical protein